MKLTGPEMASQNALDHMAAEASLAGWMVPAVRMRSAVGLRNDVLLVDRDPEIVAGRRRG